MLNKLLQQIYCQNSNDFSELLFNIYEDEDAYTIDAEYDEKLVIGRDENIVVGDKADSWESILDQVKKELAAYFKSQKNHYKNIKTIAVGFVDGDLFYIKKSRKKRKIPTFSKEDFYDFDALKLKAWLSVYLTVEAKEQYQEERWNTDFDSLTEEEFKYWCEILADNFDYSKYGK